MLERVCGDRAVVESLCDKYVEQDISNQFYANAVSKLEVMIDVYYNIKTIPLEERLRCIESLLHRINNILSSNTFSGSTLVKANVMQQQATYLISLGSQRTDCSMEEKALDVIAQALQAFYIGNGKTLTYSLISTRMQLGLIWHTCYQNYANTGDRRCGQALAAAEDAFAACIPGWEALGIPIQTTNSRYWVALVQYEAWVHGWETSKTVLESFAAAERGFDDRRNEISVSSTLNAVQDKQRLAQDKHVRDVYRLAFQVCVLDGDALQGWNWVQKAKASSLSDTLGLGCIIPQTLLAAIFAEPKAKDLFEKEKHLAQKLESASDLDRFDIRVQLRGLETEMAAHESLKALLNLRHGGAVMTQQLSDRFIRAFSQL